MNETQMKELARREGFDNAEFLGTNQLQFDSALRRYCEENACGNYGNNYACPPSCGTPGQMEEQVRRYDRALVLQTIQKVEDLTDSRQIREARALHNERTWNLSDRFEAEGITGLRIMAGPCTACSTCAICRKAPCRFPEKKASCLSAYCICAEKMAESCRMPYWCGENTVAFFSMFLPDDGKLKEKEEK
ncbi:MAG TPA: DUF2284 domain-containing protein [Candidatus Pullilachnospira intestinigallinarum]|nr:DUF2284 domain-containing protein [Candidatus Pullilachnospira intestinigallinarum]